MQALIGIPTTRNSLRKKYICKRLPVNSLNKQNKSILKKTVSTVKTDVVMNSLMGSEPNKNSWNGSRKLKQSLNKDNRRRKTSTTRKNKNELRQKRRQVNDCV